MTSTLQPAHLGRGPLLERDYWAVIRACRVRPSEIASDLARRFWEYPPPELVVFTRAPQANGPLQVGEELDVQIRLVGSCRVRVVCIERQSLTLATLRGHPEAGRITFGAYRNQEGEVIFHIRSQARSADDLTYLGFLTAGEPMQTNTWTDFVKTVALTFGEGVVGYVHAETRTLDDPGPRRRCEAGWGGASETAGTPTYRAEGD